MRKRSAERLGLMDALLAEAEMGINSARVCKALGVMLTMAV
jgi:hypothetical protein